MTATFDQLRLLTLEQLFNLLDSYDTTVANRQLYDYALDSQLICYVTPGTSSACAQHCNGASLQTRSSVPFDAEPYVRLDQVAMQVNATASTVEKIGNMPLPAALYPLLDDFSDKHIPLARRSINFDRGWSVVYSDTTVNDHLVIHCMFCAFITGRS